MNPHEKTGAAWRILQAQKMIEDARMLLIEAEQIVPLEQPNIKSKLKCCYMALFADTIIAKGGDGKFFQSADIVREIMNL